MNAVAFPEFGKIGGEKTLLCVNSFFSAHRSNKMVLLTHQSEHLPRASPFMCTPAARDLIVGGAQFIRVSKRDVVAACEKTGMTLRSMKEMMITFL